MYTNRPRYRLNKSERRGIFYFLVLAFMLKGMGWWMRNTVRTELPDFVQDENLQKTIDRLKADQISKRPDIYPFNPNYISEYQGYVLEIPTENLDRIYAFRKTGAFMNSVEDFKRVSDIPDTLLRRIRPLLRFPEWKKLPPKVPERSVKEIKDLNTAGYKDLIAIRGIGQVLGNRILKFRQGLGGFLIEEQLYDVYGLDSVVASRVLERFKVLHPPDFQKKNLNAVTSEELDKIPYFKSWQIEELLRFRDERNGFTSWEEIGQLKLFTAIQIDRIKLYLTLKNIDYDHGNNSDSEF